MKKLETERLILREWKITDAQDLYHYAKSDLVGPQAGWPPHKSIDESREIINMFIDNSDCWAIELKSENRIIGGIGLHKRVPDESLKDKNQREIGFVLNPKYWGNGLIPEAVNRLLEHGFNDLQLDIIWCGHYRENFKSKRVNEKCGFKYHFKKNETVALLNNKEVETLYYKIERDKRL